MNNEGEAVIALSGRAHGRSWRADVADSWGGGQSEVHLEGGGLLFLQLVTGWNHHPPPLDGWLLRLI